VTVVPIQPFPVRDRLTPFVTRALLSGADTTALRSAPALPRPGTQLYTPEDLRELGEVFSQGVLHAMVSRARGWERRPILVGPSADRASPSNLRLWEAPVEGLRFTKAALLLGERTYTLCRAHREKSDSRSHRRALEALAAGDWDASGDQLLAYWLLTPAWSHLTSGKRFDSLRSLLQKRPVLGLRHGPWIQAAAPNAETMDALMASATRAWLPWWMAHALDHWRGWEERLWRGDLAVHTSRRQLQHAWLTAWIDAIDRSGWYDLLPPILDHLRFLLRWLEARAIAPDADPAAQQDDPAGGESSLVATGNAGIARIRRVFRRAREMDRMRAREAWADVLLLGSRIQEMVQSVRALHPMEREAHQTLLVEVFGSDAGLCRPRPRGTDVIAATLTRLEVVGRVIGGRLG
jgi:hypothetical protein